MHRPAIAGLGLVAALVAGAATGAEIPPADAPPPILHRFVVVDNGANRLVHRDQHQPARDWSVPIPGASRDLQLVEGGKVLVSHGSGCAEYDLATGNKVWGIEGFGGTSSARRLPNGNTALLGGAAGGLVVHEVGRDGRKVRSTELKGLSANRLMRVLDNGHFLLGLAAHKVVETDETGRTVWEAAIPGKGYLAERLPGGETLSAVGEDCTIVTLDKGGQIVPGKERGGLQQHKDARLLWFSGWQLLPNGNVVVANWCGHGKAGKGPHLVEFDPRNRLVWQWEDHQAAQTVTNVLVIDECR